MKQQTATVSTILDTRRAKVDKTFPVKLRITYQRNSRMYGTIFSLTEEDFSQLQISSTKRLKETRNEISALETRARKIIEGLPVFTFETFAAKMYNKVNEASDPKDVYSAFQSYIKDMERQNRVGNAIAYKCAMTSLQKHKTKLTFEQVTAKFLKDYEISMIEKGNNLTTVGIYLRCLRSLFNSAISTGTIMQSVYPFGSVKHGKYSIPAPQNIKKALSMADIKKVFSFVPTTESESMYRDLWIFSYLCNGANMKDICLLKYSDIEGETITFRRSKTANTNRQAKPIVAAYTDRLKDIVLKWGNKNRLPSNFVFPFLLPADNEKRIKEKVAQIVKLVNKYIKRIAKATGIEANVTTYTARHSFATTLRRAGVNVSFISESMGHADIKTTENYLATIENDQRKGIAAELTNFD